MFLLSVWVTDGSLNLKLLRILWVQILLILLIGAQGQERKGPTAALHRAYLASFLVPKSSTTLVLHLLVKEGLVNESAEIIRIFPKLRQVYNLAFACPYERGDIDLGL